MCSYGAKHDTLQPSFGSGYREKENRPPYPTGAKDGKWNEQKKQQPNSYPQNPPGRQFGMLVNTPFPKRTTPNPMPAPAAPGRAQEPTHLHVSLAVIALFPANCNISDSVSLLLGCLAVWLFVCFFHSCGLEMSLDLVSGN